MTRKKLTAIKKTSACCAIWNGSPSYSKEILAAKIKPIFGRYGRKTTNHFCIL